MLKSKSQQIREALLAEDHISALRIAAHFYDRSPRTMIYKRGIDAYKHPAFYRQLGNDPHYLTLYAITILRENFLVTKTIGESY